MKTQRRHELQTNKLADEIGRYLQMAKPYSRQIGLGALAAVLIVGAVIYLIHQQTTSQALGWSEFLRAFNTYDSKALAEVGKLKEGTTAGLWARQAAGDFNLAEGAHQLFRDRKEALRLLEEAESSYLAVEKEGGKYPMLVERARFGLGQAYESMSKVDKARQYYQKVAETAQDATLATVAKQRAERLANKSVEGWYAWFERQEPAPPPSTLPGAKIAEPKVPADLEKLPATPDLPKAEAKPEAKESAAKEPAAKEPAAKEAASKPPAGK
jgi:tetratricopeptide (TPR) repeat protein